MLCSWGTLSRYPLLHSLILELMKVSLTIIWPCRWESSPSIHPLEARSCNFLHYKTVPVTLLIIIFSFHIIDCPQNWYPRLKNHNPHINWTLGEIISWSIIPHSNCLHSALAPGNTEPLPLPEPPDLCSVPEVYQDPCNSLWQISCFVSATSSAIWLCHWPPARCSFPQQLALQPQHN